MITITQRRRLVFAVLVSVLLASGGGLGVVGAEEDLATVSTGDITFSAVSSVAEGNVTLLDPQGNAVETWQNPTLETVTLNETGAWTLQSTYKNKFVNRTENATVTVEEDADAVYLKGGVGVAEYTIYSAPIEAVTDETNRKDYADDERDITITTSAPIEQLNLDVYGFDDVRVEVDVVGSNEDVRVLFMDIQQDAVIYHGEDNPVTSTFSPWGELTDRGALVEGEGGVEVNVDTTPSFFQKQLFDLRAWAVEHDLPAT